MRFYVHKSIIFNPFDADIFKEKAGGISAVSDMASFSLNPLDNREIWFTNMLLLEFDPASSEEKFKVPFSR